MTCHSSCSYVPVNMRYGQSYFQAKESITQDSRMQSEHYLHANSTSLSHSHLDTRTMYLLITRRRGERQKEKLKEETRPLLRLIIWQWRILISRCKAASTKHLPNLWLNTHYAKTMAVNMHISASKYDEGLYVLATLSNYQPSRLLYFFSTF